MFSIEKLNQLLVEHYDIEGIEHGQLKPLPSYCDQNALLTCSNDRYIVKIAHPDESFISLQMQNAMMDHLIAKEQQVPYVLNNKKGEQISVIKRLDKGLDSLANNSADLYLRVLSYLPGCFYADADNHNYNLLRDLGQFMANLNISLDNFEHPGAFRYLEWDLAHGYQVCMSKKHLLKIGDSAKYELVEYFLRHYHNHTLPLLGQLPQGVIHNDANDYNLLVDSQTDAHRITGIIDFGDVVHTQIINELAIAAAYALMGQAEIVTCLSKLVAGYHSKRPLSDLELEVLYSLITLRLCVSVCNSTQAIIDDPNNDYLLISAKPAWQLLEKLKKLNPFALLCKLRASCGLTVQQGLSSEDILDIRQQHLSKALSVNYEQPLKIVRGQGAYLFDDKGNGYLDMVNNVCHVGHCNPKVVAAGQQQMAKLNTNTRFLHDNIVNYSKRLLATFPDELSVCFFVNSGSEANELAMRLAQCYTGSKELVCVDGAYHGNTAACISASPYKFNGTGGKGPEPHVHIVKLPDPYRGEYTTAEGYVEDVKKVVANIQSQGLKPGTFICESIQGVAGQVFMPQGYLKGAYQAIRDAGGVCIADEVQVGFGRVGTHMWAFETQEVIPDIVSLGKPIGNGHPIGAVVTTAAIAEAFVNGMEYFNTFGGNPVSCAIGLAVLDEVESGLQQNALETGAYMKDELVKLQHEFDCIGDVRGMGLFVGVEFVECRQSKAPNKYLTGQLIEFAKANQVLLGSDGPYGNILKIKPPIVYDKADTDKFIDVMRRGLLKLAC